MVIEGEDWALIGSDCIEAMKALGDSSIDALVTDPPYGIRFMGKAWDTMDIAAKTDRQGNVWNARAPSAAAGEYDLSPEAMVAFQGFTSEWARQAFRLLKPGGHLISFASPRTYHRMACGIEEAGFEIRDQLQWLYGSGFPKSVNVSRLMLERAEAAGTGGLPDEAEGWFQDAERWKGWGTALKPAHEPVVLARKPFSVSVVANLIEWGTGALNVGGCKVELTEDENLIRRNAVDAKVRPGQAFGTNEGRWPANVMASTEAGSTVDEMAPESGARAPVKGTEPSSASTGQVTNLRRRVKGKFHADQGGPSRFWYVPKTAKWERNFGCEDLPELSGGAATDRKDGSAGVNNPRAGAGRTGGARNHHPTVKPVELMRYLCRLITPPGGVVLDPFVGSGTTGMAALLEGFRFVGVERELSYLEIARRRILAADEHRRGNAERGDEEATRSGPQGPAAVAG